MSRSAPRRTEAVLASANPGKLVEIRAILADLPLRLRPLSEFPRVALPAEGDDYEANARAKARGVAEQTGLPALADDSGLEVAALSGAPGPRSARYGGGGLDDRGRCQRLLAELTARPGAARGARFVCVAALAMPDGAGFVASGSLRGRILCSARGAGGFGYDPIFAVEGRETSVAELSASEKNAISHRARAFRALVPVIREQLGLQGRC